MWCYVCGEMKLLLVNISINALVEAKEQGSLLFDAVGSVPMASEKAELFSYDCIIIQLDSIEQSVFEWLSLLAEGNRREGIVLVSHKNAVEQKIKAFDMGVDDFIVLPIDAYEFLARVKAIVRRKTFNTKSKLYIGHLVIDTFSRTVKVWDNVLSLTKTEYDILLHLIANKDKVISKMALAEYLWGDEVDQLDSYNVLFAHIKNLRKKILTAKGGIEIQNVYRVGYQIIEI